ncbi:MAG: hypothetical protein NVS3B12_30110 [Acidimicrobiales bacterium]
MSSLAASHWGAWRRSVVEWRSVVRLAGGLWLANSIVMPLAYGMGRGEMPHARAFLVHGLANCAFGGLLLLASVLTPDSLVAILGERSVVILVAWSYASDTLGMYFGGPMTTPAMLVFDITAILAFYLLERRVAIATCFVGAACYAGLLWATRVPSPEWFELIYLTLSLLVTGFLTGRLIELIDRERKAKEAARAELADLNLHLESRVADQVEEIRESRARIVAASDESRRRIERNIHDGAQQQLVAISLDLRLLAEGVDQLPIAEIRAQLSAAGGHLRETLDDLRELARGLHPTLLTTDGLEAALAQLAARCPIPVSVLASPARFPDQVETAAYFLVAEALANVVKHAGATCAEVVVCDEHDILTVSVIDDGRGGATPSPGGGLSGLVDRVAATGGTLVVTSQPGAGTTLTARLPLNSQSHRSGAITHPPAIAVSIS